MFKFIITSVLYVCVLGVKRVYPHVIRSLSHHSAPVIVLGISDVVSVYLLTPPQCIC